MRCGEALRATFDRRFMTSLLLLLAVRAIELALGEGYRFSSDDGSLPTVYSKLTRVDIALYCVVPLFVLGCSGSLGRSLSPATVLRWGSRRRMTRWHLLRSLVRGLAYSVVLVASALVAITLRSPLSFPVPTAALFVPVELALETMFLSACGMLLLASFVASGHGGTSVLVVLAYASVDYLLGMTELSGDHLFATGWSLTTLTGSTGIVDVLGCAARRAAILALLVLCCDVLLSGRDLLAEGGGRQDD